MNRKPSLSGQVGLKMASRAQRPYLDGLHGSWAMEIALFGVSFLCALISKREGKVSWPGDCEKDDQGSLVPMA